MNVPLQHTTDMSSAEPAQTWRRSLTLILISEVFLSFGFGLSMYAIPFYYHSAGLSDRAIGLLFAVNATVSGLAAIVIGMVGDKVGASRVFKAASLIVPSGYLMLGLTHALWLWVVAGSLSGLGGAGLMSTENVVISSLAQGHDRAGLFSRFTALYMFAIGAGVVSAGFLTHALTDRGTLVLGAVIALVAPALRLLVTAPDARAHRLFRLPSRRIIAMTLFAVLFAVGANLISPFATLIARDHFGLGSRMTAVFYATSLFMTSFGSLAVSRLLRRFRRQRTLLVSFVVGITLTLVMAGWHVAAVFVIGYLARIYFLSIPQSIVDAAFVELSHETEYAQMFGTRVFGSSIGQAIGSAAGGTLLNHRDLSGLLIASAASMLAAYLYLAALMRRFQFHAGGHTSLEAPAVTGD